MATGGGAPSGGGHGGGGNSGHGGFNGGYYGYGYGYPFYNQYYILNTPQTCTTVYNNQAAINAANAQLAACNASGTCNASTLAAIHSTQAANLAAAQAVGTSCSNNNGIYPSFF